MPLITYNNQKSTAYVPKYVLNKRHAIVLLQMLPKQWGRSNYEQEINQQPQTVTVACFIPNGDLMIFIKVDMNSESVFAGRQSALAQLLQA